MTGIVLAGGKSSRMGSNKALLRLGAKTIIEIVITRLKVLFDEIIIISNTPSDYQEFGLNVYPDLLPAKGALGGIHSALTHSPTTYSFIVACDMPFINTDLVSYLLSECGSYDVTIPFTPKGYQPLHAIYSKGCIEHIERQIDGDNLKVLDLFAELEVRKVRSEEIKPYDPEFRSFINLNTWEDYLVARRDYIINN